MIGWFACAGLVVAGWETPVVTTWPHTRQKRASGTSGALQRVQFMAITFQSI